MRLFANKNLKALTDLNISPKPSSNLANFRIKQELKKLAAVCFLVKFGAIPENSDKLTALLPSTTDRTLLDNRLLQVFNYSPFLLKKSSALNQLIEIGKTIDYLDSIESQILFFTACIAQILQDMNLVDDDANRSFLINELTERTSSCFAEMQKANKPINNSDINYSESAICEISNTTYYKTFSFIAKFGNPYELLKIKSDASVKEIARAYQNAVKALHPDKNKDSAAIKKFYQIIEAYHLLSSEGSRWYIDNIKSITYSSPSIKPQFK